MFNPLSYLMTTDWKRSVPLIPFINKSSKRLEFIAKQIENLSSSESSDRKIIAHKCNIYASHVSIAHLFDKRIETSSCLKFIDEINHKVKASLIENETILPNIVIQFDGDEPLELPACCWHFLYEEMNYFKHMLSIGGVEKLTSAIDFREVNIQKKNFLIMLKVLEEKSFKPMADLLIEDLENFNEMALLLQPVCFLSNESSLKVELFLDDLALHTFIQRLEENEKSYEKAVALNKCFMFYPANATSFKDSLDAYFLRYFKEEILDHDFESKRKDVLETIQTANFHLFQYEANFDKKTKIIIDNCVNLKKVDLRVVQENKQQQIWDSLVDLAFLEELSFACSYTHLPTLTPLKSTNLQSLRLSTPNGFNGVGLMFLKDSNLKTLSMNTAHFNEMRVLNELEHLENLEVSFLGNGFQQLNELTLGRLKNLTLSSEHLNDDSLSFLSHCIRLESLSLRGCENVEGGFLEFIKQHTDLKSLGIHLCKKFKGSYLEHIKDLHLKALEISCKFIGFKDEHLENLQSMTSLEVLSITHANITDKGFRFLSRLINLKSLNLFDCQSIKGKGLRYLEDCVNLEYLNLRFCSNFLDKNVIYLKNFKKLKNFLFDCAEKLTANSLVNIKDLTNLEFLPDLNTLKGFSDKHLEYLQNLTKLTKLDLSKTSVTGSGFVYLNNLIHLKNLDLRRTRVKDESFRLLKIEKIENLNISFTPFIGSGLKYLAKWKNLRFLDLEYSALETRFIPIFIRFNRLEYLRLSSCRCLPYDIQTFYKGNKLKVFTLLLKMNRKLDAQDPIKIKFSYDEIELLNENVLMNLLQEINERRDEKHIIDQKLLKYMKNFLEAYPKVFSKFRQLINNS